MTSSSRAEREVEYVLGAEERELSACMHQTSIFMQKVERGVEI